MKKAKLLKKLPRLESIEALAKFWDEHDVTDYDAQLKEVKDRVFDRSAKRTLVIQLDARSMKGLKQVARANGVGHASLARRWIQNEIQREKGGKRSKPRHVRGRTKRSGATATAR